MLKYNFYDPESNRCLIAEIFKIFSIKNLYLLNTACY